MAGEPSTVTFLNILSKSGFLKLRHDVKRDVIFFQDSFLKLAYSRLFSSLIFSLASLMLVA